MAIEWTFVNTGIVITGVLSAVSCALIGSYMVLRRMSMMGDAISHAVLPGIAVAFLLTGSRDSVAMLVGAAVVGVLTAVFTQSVHHFGNVERNASMGVVFTTLFAVGLILIVRGADHVDLDPGCVLYGAIEQVALDSVLIFGVDVPRAAITQAVVLALNLGFVVLFYKELKISSFDPELATTVGINAQVMHYLLMTLVAVTTVAAFESVGSILVIAMLIVPGAIASLLTERLGVMLWLSVVIAAASAVLGHLGALIVPGWFGFGETSTSGMMAVMTGLLLVIAIIAAPRQGLISRAVSRLRLQLRIIREDILGLLYRLREMPDAAERFRPELLIEADGVHPLIYRLAVHMLRRQGKICSRGDGFELTETGLVEAGNLIRSHRLWETFVYEQMNYPVQELHFSAERFEHVTDDQMLRTLEAQSSDTDPQGHEIPPRRD